jgi:hypothetical protein
MRRLAVLAWLALAAAATAVARSSLEPEATALGRIRDPAWVPSGRVVRLASFGQRLLLADVYWLKTVAYVGEWAMQPERGMSALLPLADLVTDLDPRFGYAYQVAGSNLSGLGRLVPESNRILEKGMRNVPGRWSLPFLYAFNKFFYEGDFATAARFARRAADVGKRPHLALLAANLSLVANRDDEYLAALQILEVSLQQAETPELRAQLRGRIVKVKTYQALSLVERAVAAFRERNVRRPIVVEELTRGGFLQAVPADPSGGVIILDPTTGEVRSSVVGPRRPVRVTDE